MTRPLLSEADVRRIYVRLFGGKCGFEHDDMRFAALVESAVLRKIALRKSLMQPCDYRWDGMAKELRRLATAAARAGKGKA